MDPAALHAGLVSSHSPCRPAAAEPAAAANSVGVDIELAPVASPAAGTRSPRQHRTDSVDRHPDSDVAAVLGPLAAIGDNGGGGEGDTGGGGGVAAAGSFVRNG